MLTGTQYGRRHELFTPTRVIVHSSPERGTVSGGDTGTTPRDPARMPGPPNLLSDVPRCAESTWEA